MKRNRFKIRITAMMVVSVLALWFALPDVAYARTVTIEGRKIESSFSASSSSAAASIYYTEGTGKVTASVNGYAYSNSYPETTKKVSASNGSNPTPGGASASVNAPSGYRFYAADSSCSYEVYINGTTYSGTISDNTDL